MINALVEELLLMEYCQNRISAYLQLLCVPSQTQASRYYAYKGSIRIKYKAQDVFFITAVLNSVILHVLSPMKINFDYFRASSMEFKQECSKQVVDNSKVFKKIQGLCLPEPI